MIQSISNAQQYLQLPNNRNDNTKSTATTKQRRKKKKKKSHKISFGAGVCFIVNLFLNWIKGNNKETTTKRINISRKKIGSQCREHTVYSNNFWMNEWMKELNDEEKKSGVCWEPNIAYHISCCNGDHRRAHHLIKKSSSAHHLTSFFFFVCCLSTSLGNNEWINELDVVRKLKRVK